MREGRERTNSRDVTPNKTSQSNSLAKLDSQQSSSSEDLQSSDSGSEGQMEGKEVSWSVVADRMWEDWQLPVLLVLISAISVVLLTFLILLWLKNQMLPRSKSVSGGESSSTSGQWIFHPVVKPPLETCDSVQPSDEGVPPLAAVPVLETRPEPIRIKAKGLLERRGSSASLTIDLHPSQENLAVVTPTKECSTQEFLLSAGNRYSRGQLRNCLKNPRTLHSEFWDIPSNIPERTELAGSGTKNRYRSILPNENSRVKLPEVDGDPLTGYINANYVRGYEGEEKAYIATQGPLPHTLHDFWSMVLQERACAIVMITRLREKGRAKCEPYLPSNVAEPLSFEDIEVEVKREADRPGYQVRDIVVKRGEEQVELRHFWFTDWTDHKAPDDAGSLVSMAEEVEQLRLESGATCVQTEELEAAARPVVVHCSAGIGRTGCFIAVATGMRQLSGEANVDILGIVCSMRQDRGGMVQTGEQYEFIHRALCLYERSLPPQTGD